LNLIIFLKKCKNSYLTPRINSLNFKKFYEKNSFFIKVLAKIFWFIPNNFQSKYWINAHNVGHGYDKFVEMDDLGCMIVDKIKEYSAKEDKILDICCNVGRILNQLNNHGYKKLYGFDINQEAINKSKFIFSGLNSAQLECASAEEYLKKTNDNFYDVSYSLGASLEVIPAHFNLIKDINRITKKYFICLISENGHAYPRFWRNEFKRSCFSIIECINVGSSRTLFVLEKK